VLANPDCPGTGAAAEADQPGVEAVTAAEVSEQTAYNYFQTKEQLVTNRDQLVQWMS
jgi:hypothetical protein